MVYMLQGGALRRFINGLHRQVGRANIPFCLFFRLVKFCNLVPSRGAKGWRVVVAMVAGRWGEGWGWAQGTAELLVNSCTQFTLRSIAAGPIPREEIL